jgi:hypothetical protein
MGTSPSAGRRCSNSSKALCYNKLSSVILSPAPQLRKCLGDTAFDINQIDLTDDDLTDDEFD